MIRTFSFEKLNVWQKAKHLSVVVYKLTSEFLSEEKFGLTNQMSRSCISISSNIAEGSGRHSMKDQARFTEIAYSSALELLNQLILSLELEFITRENYNLNRSHITEILAMLDGLYKSQKKVYELHHISL